jgi:hypothetical protein
MEKIELKPCPCCGTSNPMVLDNTPGRYSYIECRHCTLRTNEYDRYEDAVKVWNMRIEQDRLKARNAKLESTLCWIAEKDNTYVKERELILHIARASLNVHCGYDFKINAKYSHLIDELKEDCEVGE